jgi:putative ABC transport system permease protein
VIIASIITISACIALSIRQSAETAREASIDQMKITAQISVDRQAMLKSVQSGDRTNVLRNIQGISLEEMLSYAKSGNVDDFYYTLTSSLNSDEATVPVDTSEVTESTEDLNTQFEGMGPGGSRRGFAGMGNQGDFTVVGYSSHNAMSTFMDGTCKVIEGSVFAEDTKEPDCLISDELALLNDLTVGDTITLINPNDEEETVVMKINGIYHNSEAAMSSGGDMMGFNAASDPANRIYTSYTALRAVVDNSEANAVVEVDETTGREISTALRGQEAGTYVLADATAYDAFQKDAEDLGLDTSIYAITSPDLDDYEQSMIPLERLSSYAAYFLLIVLIIGGAILVIFQVFAIRERKYEIGVLAAIGMNKRKVAAQFIAEVFIVTFIAIIIGTGTGSVISVPVANRLLQDQVQAVEVSQQTTMNNFGGGFEGRIPGGAGFLQGRMDGSGDADYISSISANVDIVVLLQLLFIGILLTLVSSASAIVSILRYDPLKILSNRS